MSENGLTALILFLSTCLSGCIVLPVQEHQAAYLNDGKVESYRHRCSGGSHWVSIPGGSIEVSQGESPDVLKWTVSRRVSSSFKVSPRPLMFKFTDGETVNSLGRLQLRRSRPHPQEIYPWQDGYEISWNEDSTRAVVTQRVKVSGEFWGDRYEVIKTLDYDYRKTLVDVPFGLLYTLSPLEGFSFAVLIQTGQMKFKPKTVEVEIPSSSVDGVELDSIKVWFKFVDSWAIFPLNC